MADDNSTPDNGIPADGEPEIEARVVAQFVRDLSFESPNIESLINGPGDNPNLNMEVNVNARQVQQHLYESTIEFKASATNNVGVIYDIEVIYGGMFHVENMPREALEGFLLVNCPSILFPFLRRIVADLTREGGFPPLFLDPIDFAALYIQRMNQQGGDDQGNPPIVLN